MLARPPEMTTYALLAASLWLLTGAAVAARYATTWRAARWFVALGPLPLIAKLVSRNEQRHT